MTIHRITHDVAVHAMATISAAAAGWTWLDHVNELARLGASVMAALAAAYAIKLSIARLKDLKRSQNDKDRADKERQASRKDPEIRS